MISEKFLLNLEFKKQGLTPLPDWFNLFEEPHVLECEAYTLWAHADYYLTVYFTPRGVLVEIGANDEFDFSLQYDRVRTHEDLLECIMTHLDLKISWVVE